MISKNENEKQLIEMLTRDVIIACDFASAEATFAFLDKFRDERRKPFLKIGMELYYAEGPSIVREIKRRGHRIFLDLKLHDIPNTVKKAMAVLSRLDVDMCNVHAAGTVDMMRAAVEGLTRADGTRPLLIAVTQLTSTSEERMRGELLIDAPIGEVIVKYARNAKEAGLDGVVCSPWEAREIHEKLGNYRLFKKQPAPTEIRRAVTLLKKYQVIEPLDLLEDLKSESRMIIYPCINVVLMGDDVRCLLSSFEDDSDESGVQLKADLEEEEPDATDGMTEDGMAEDEMTQDEMTEDEMTEDEMASEEGEPWNRK